MSVAVTHACVYTFGDLIDFVIFVSYRYRDPVSMSEYGLDFQMLIDDEKKLQSWCDDVVSCSSRVSR